MNAPRKVNGAAKSYLFGAKELWRRQMWNALAKASWKQKGVTLYLAGPEDNDRRIATSKGFSTHDLIGIDVSKSNVQRVRESGGYAIHGAAVDVMTRWPERVPVRAVVLDFCSGVTNERLAEVRAALVMQNEHGRSPAVCLNFMRGRDSSSNALRGELEWVCAAMLTEHIQACAGSPRDLRKGTSLARYFEDAVIGKHRAAQALYMAVRPTTLPVCVDAPIDDAYIKALAYAVTFWRAGTPKSYKSGPLVFDSIVIPPYPVQSLADLGCLSQGKEPALRGDAISRSITATLATRTRRRESRARQGRR